MFGNQFTFSCSAMFIFPFIIPLLEKIAQKEEKLENKNLLKLHMQTSGNLTNQDKKG